MRGRLTNLGGPLLAAYFAYAVVGIVFDLSLAPLLPMLAAVLVFTYGPRLWNRVPSEEEREAATVEVAPPVEGDWVGLNTPADKVPSHGTHQFGQTYAIDILMGSDRPGFDGWKPLSRRPDEYPSFGEPLLAVADATVVRVRDGMRDHRSRSSWPGIVYMLVIEGFVRSLGGARWVVGNHVILDLGDGVYAAYAHMKKGSADVREGDRVTVGQRIGLCGNTGNSSEPHLHFQLMDHTSFNRALGIPFTWTGVGVPKAGETFSAPTPGPAPR